MQGERTLVEAAHILLANRIMRRVYDRGKRVSLELSSEDNAQMAALTQQLQLRDKVPLQHLGEWSLDTAANTIAFYVAVGMSQAVKCLRANDPDSCKQYFESLTKWSGNAGMFIFAGVSHVTTNGLSNFLKGGASYGGLAAGSIAFDVFNDLANLPESGALMKDLSKDPLHCAKCQNDLQGIYGKTFGNKDWYSDKAPDLMAMLTAAFLSNSITTGAKFARQKISAIGNKGSCSLLYRILNPNLPKIVRYFGDNLAGTGLFLGMNALTQPGANWLWQIITLDRKLAKSRESLTGLVEQYKENPTSKNQTRVKNAVEENRKLWDSYQQIQMSDVAALNAVHRNDLVNLEKTLNKANFFYTWLFHGASIDENDPDFQAIRDTFYGAETPASQILKDGQNYAKSFFCGPMTPEAFHDSVDLHGIPVPGRFDISVEPYRVVPNLEKKICSLSSQQLIQKIQTNDLALQKIYHDGINDTNAKIQVMGEQARFRQIDLYEASVEHKITGVLSDGQEREFHLPRGIIPSLETELADLNQWKNKVAGTPLAGDLEKNILGTQEIQKAANNLLAYFQKTKAEREAMGNDENSPSVQGSTDASPNDPYEKSASYFQSFILQSEL